MSFYVIDWHNRQIKLDTQCLSKVQPCFYTAYLTWTLCDRNTLKITHPRFAF